MPSKYKSKDQKKRYNLEKQDSTLSYKQHYKAPTELEMCSVCANTRPVGSWNYGKYCCGGTYQRGRSLGMVE